MKKIIYYVGLDVHKNSIAAATPSGTVANSALVTQQLEHAGGDLRPLHRYSTAGNNTFRKEISAHTLSC